ncbi:MAG: Cysteine dioxygenase, partial [uncultured Thermomicrobiales bacterium]
VPDLRRAADRQGPVRPGHASPPGLRRRGRRDPDARTGPAGDRGRDPPGLRRLAGREGMAAGALPGAVRRQRHGIGDRDVVALPGGGWRVGVLVLGGAPRCPNPGPRPPRLGVGRPLPGRAGRGGVPAPRRRWRRRPGRFGAGRAPPPDPRRLLRTAAGERHPPRPHHLRRHLRLLAPARQRQRLRLAPPLPPRGGSGRTVPLRIRQRAVRRQAGFL